MGDPPLIPPQGHVPHRGLWGRARGRALGRVQGTADPEVPRAPDRKAKVRTPFSIAQEAAVSPTERTLRLLREMGYQVEVVERWNPYSKTRQDLFGCIDLVAVREGFPVLGVQATSRSNVSARVRKAEQEPRLTPWLASGATFEVWGWGRVQDERKRLRMAVRRLRAHLAGDAVEFVELTASRGTNGAQHEAEKTRNAQGVA